MSHHRQRLGQASVAERPVCAPACTAKEREVPITPYLRNQAFDPETVIAMSEAFVAARQALGIVDRDDPLNELIAKRVIELAQMGVRNADALYARTLQEFKTDAA